MRTGARTWAALALVAALAVTHARLQRRGDTVYSQGMECGPLDIAFVLDTTGSMDEALRSVADELAGFLNRIEIASQNNYRLAQVTFKDNVTVEQTFAQNNRAAFEPQIRALRATGGAGEPEASDEALNTLPAAGRPQNRDFNTPFRPEARKVIILVTDARPGGFDDQFTRGVDDVRARTFAQPAATQAIRISSVYVSRGGASQEIARSCSSTRG